MDVFHLAGIFNLASPGHRVIFVDIDGIEHNIEIAEILTRYEKDAKDLEVETVVVLKEQGI